MDHTPNTPPGADTVSLTYRWLAGLLIAILFGLVGVIFRDIAERGNNLLLKQEALEHRLIQYNERLQQVEWHQSMIRKQLEEVTQWIKALDASRWQQKP